MISLVVCALIGVGLIAEVVEHLELRRKIRHAWHATPTDRATGLLIGEVLERRTEAELRRVRRFGGRLQLVCIRVANAGDAVTECGTWLREGCRFPAVPFRTGPCEFAVLLAVPDELSREQGLNALPDTDIDGEWISGSGVSTWPTDGDSPMALLDHARATVSPLT